MWKRQVEHEPKARGTQSPRLNPTTNTPDSRVSNYRRQLMPKAWLQTRHRFPPRTMLENALQQNALRSTPKSHAYVLPPARSRRGKAAATTAKMAGCENSG